MALVGSVGPAAPGVIGFDSATKINSAQANRYFSQNYRFCVRYVSRDDASRQHNENHGTPDLSETEAQGILNAGLALMVVQHCPLPGWNPSAQLGTTYGQNAAQYAADAGLPAGVNVWLDLEGIANPTSHQDIIAYCNKWFSEVQTGGYEPGVYVGFDVFLSPDELYFDLKTKHYWRAEGHIPDISHRGYQMVQHVQNAGSADEFDQDVTKNDAFGGAAIWLASSASPIA